MNYDAVVPTLFPGAPGRIVAELTSRHARGDEEVGLAAAAAAASVVPHQLDKVVTRLALLGLVEFPDGGYVRLVREHVLWAALAELAHPQDRIDALVRQVVASTVEPELDLRVVLAGPVAHGTALSFHDGLVVALISSHSVPAAVLSSVARSVERGTGNSCTAAAYRSLEDALRDMPPGGHREVTVPDPSTPAPV